jgi:hypothetical protein
MPPTPLPRMDPETHVEVPAEPIWQSPTIIAMFVALLVHYSGIVAQHAGWPAEVITMLTSFWTQVVTFALAALAALYFRMKANKPLTFTSHTKVIPVEDAEDAGKTPGPTSTVRYVTADGRPTSTLRTWIVTWGIIALATTSSGCMTRAEHAALREGMYQSTSIERSEHVEWSKILAGDNNMDGQVTPDDGNINLKALPDLSAKTVEQRNAWLKARLREHEEYEHFVESSRANDNLFGPPKPSPTQP